VRTLDSAPDGATGYEDAVAAGDEATAIALIEQMLTAGTDPVQVLTNVIAAAQRANGIRWLRGECTVAEEHAATAMAVSSTKVVLRHVRRTPATRGPVLVACAEREWHALPAMMIHAALRVHGWDSTLLGASTSPMRLSQHLQDVGPEAVAVSCSMLGALPTTRRFIEASTATGVPVMVGGAAFGPDDVRARALGATAWARDAHGAVAVMHGLPLVVSPAPPLPSDMAGEQSALELDHRDLVESLRQRWSPTAGLHSSGKRPSQGVLDVADDVLHQTLHAVSAALLTGDPRPVPDTFAWVGELLRSRGAEAAQVDELGRQLVATLREYPQARELVEQHCEGTLAAG
jgi:MerR family transcriptional regulator, light-induced transcriptional regulator